ncbi:excinuclease ABC subunit UvrC [Gammaproteobacteria bacterium]|nr:excinuclease ABC subunit UvrC [Gammaproteobacteria bacterium]
MADSQSTSQATPQSKPQAKSQSDTQAFDSASFLKHASPRPGVYRMFDSNGEILYVGKAKNLKKRLSSYFRGSGLDNKTIALVNKIHSIETTITNSETEALLLEHNLIKEHRPPYNILLRDDKSYPYIFLSTNDIYPRLALHRGAKKKQGKYFGPFPGAGAVRESLNLLQKVFHVRQCEDSFFSNRTRPCLQYQIKRCSGPCVNLTSEEDYAEDVRHSIMFLEGKSEQIKEELDAKMDAYAKALEFEKASVIRDQIRDLRVVQERQYVSGEKGDVDILALNADAGIVCIQVIFVRGGRVLGNKNYYPKLVIENEAPEIMHAFIGQFYLRENSQHSVPKEIIVSHKPEDLTGLQAALEYFSGHKVSLKNNVRGHRQKWLELAITNAEHGLMSKLNSKQSMQNRFNALHQALGTTDIPTRLECFDISHSSGEATVASCVVFDQNGPLKSDYRRFNIDNITAGDDYAAMEQALKRRYTRLKEGEARMPDLLVIDGGKGQLGQAEKVLAELEVNNVLLLGIAKGISRKAGQETLFLGGSHKEIVLPAESPALHLLQHIRDESHRFAITAHRQRRGKQRTQSFLDTIPGIGPKKRRDLIRHFGGQQEIKKASIDELHKVSGISKNLAEQLYDAMHS